MWDRLSYLDNLSGSKLTIDAAAIWQAGVDAVRPAALFERKLKHESSRLVIDDQCEIDLARVRRMIVVGAGKASAAMAEAFYDKVQAALPAKGGPEILGWINAPEGSFSRQLPGIQLFPARPAAFNLPTPEAIKGTQRIIELVSHAGADDIVVCLLSGGGSALLVSPCPGISLEDKQNVARLVSAAGGNINQLNTIRRCLSRVKGGGLARASSAGRMVSLIISDVLGDSLDIIASGPTSMSPPITARTALSLLRELDLISVKELRHVVDWLNKRSDIKSDELITGKIENIILGNNSDAVDASGVKAVELGYRYLMQTARQPEGPVEVVARQACEAIELIRNSPDIDCWISGGEPTVNLPSFGGGMGGRNQHLVLNVLRNLMQKDWPRSWQDRQLTFLSGGTDGEDGPTDAAGAFFDASTFDRVHQAGCDPDVFLDRADSYHFFEKVGGLIQCGPTGTNVCDLRVALCSSGQ
jgi:glycerate 2-kinase